MSREVVTRVRFQPGHPVSLCEALEQTLKDRDITGAEAAGIVSAMQRLGCPFPTTKVAGAPDPRELLHGEADVYLTVVSHTR